MLASRIKKLSKDSLIYGVGGALARSINIILLLVYSNFFGKDLYGVYSNIVNATTLFFTLLVFGMDGVSNILYFETDDLPKRREVVSAWVYFAAIVSVPFCLLLVLVAAPLAGAAAGDAKYTASMALAILGIPFTTLTYIFSCILRMNFRPTASVALNGFTALVNVAIGLLLVGALKWDERGALVGVLVSGLLSAALGLWLTRDSYLLRLSRSALGELLRLSWPLAPSIAAAWVNSYASGYFILHMISSGETGVFSVALRVSVIVGLVAAAFQLAWGPYALSIAREPDAKRTYAKVLTYYMVGFGGLALALGLFGHELLALIDQQHRGYAEGYKVLGLLAYSSVVGSAYYITAIGVSITKRTGDISRISVTAAAANIALNFALIPWLGMVGAALASLAAALITVWFAEYLARRNYHVPFEMGKVGSTLLLGLALMALGLLVNSGHWWLDALLKLSILAVYAIVLPLLGIITPREMDVAFHAVTKRLRRV